jgi:endonuclease/exonuclease/phosphatase family metal-dependent hydrolase
MSITIVTWNLNTWINKARKNITNEQLWRWALANVPADVYIFTEAQIPPPKVFSNLGWRWVHRPGGFPGVGNWGTVIAVNSAAGLQIEHVGRTGRGSMHILDQKYPGTLTAARLKLGDKSIATVIGLHLRYRKNKQREFIGHPVHDLGDIRSDIEAIAKFEDTPLVVAGDLNYEYLDVPNSLRRIGARARELVDPFSGGNLLTFEQDWADRKRFKLDYIYLSRGLASSVVGKTGGITEFPASLQMSDHAPLSVSLSLKHAE